MSQNIMSGLGGQRVIVTAGAGGIGEATVRLLHAEGCRIALCDVSDEALGRIGSELPGITTLRADVSDEGDVARFFEAALSALGGLDALVNNAGIAGPTGGVEDISVADWRRCLDTVSYTHLTLPTSDLV